MGLVAGSIHCMYMWPHCQNAGKAGQLDQCTLLLEPWHLTEVFLLLGNHFSCSAGLNSPDPPALPARAGDAVVWHQLSQATQPFFVVQELPILGSLPLRLCKQKEF